MYLLDTDHLSILQRPEDQAFPRLMSRIASADPAEIFVSIVSFQEQVTGWNNYVSRARSPESLVYGYRMLRSLLGSYCKMQIHDFERNAADLVETWRASRVRIGTMDLRIAAIALTNGLTLVTRNTVDFEKVPGLKLEDWLT
ncbi:MAG: type II toxin-antitoxin system VapC family toxin [Pirellulaceae bacterium]